MLGDTIKNQKKKVKQPRVKKMIRVRKHQRRISQDNLMDSMEPGKHQIFQEILRPQMRRERKRMQSLLQRT